MTPDQRRAIEALRELPSVDGNELDSELQDISLSDVLDGSIPLEMSHEGGEFAALTHVIQCGMGTRRRSVTPSISC